MAVWPRKIGTGGFVAFKRKLPLRAPVSVVRCNFVRCQNLPFGQPDSEGRLLGRRISSLQQSVLRKTPTTAHPVERNDQRQLSGSAGAGSVARAKAPGVVSAAPLPTIPPSVSRRVQSFPVSSHYQRCPDHRVPVGAKDDRTTTFLQRRQRFYRPERLIFCRPR